MTLQYEIDGELYTEGQLENAMRSVRQLSLAVSLEDVEVALSLCKSDGPIAENERRDIVAVLTAVLTCFG